MKGNYTGPTSPLLGPLSGAQFTLSYGVLRYALGGTYNFGKTPIYADLGILGDQGYGRRRRARELHAHGRVHRPRLPPLA